MWLDRSSAWSLLFALSIVTFVESGYSNSGNDEPRFQCRTEGFHADPEEPVVFYRCVNFGTGPLVKYRFVCGPGTVFSKSAGDVCVHGPSCGSSGCAGTNDGSDKINDIDTNNKPGTGKEKPGVHGKPESGPPSSSPSPPSPPCSRCDATKLPGPGTSVPVTPSSVAASQTTPQVPVIGTQCTCAGFMADPHDCYKFYQCVDDGNGSYRKYEFACGPGTIWDPKINTCNHPWAANRADCSGSSVTTRPTAGSPSVGSTSGSFAPTEATASTVTSVINSETSTHPSNQPTNGPPCTCAGFMADPKDCTKFYKCVDNGMGSYKRDEFQCAEGAFWYQNAGTCDYPADGKPPASCKPSTDSTAKPSAKPVQETTLRPATQPSTVPTATQPPTVPTATQTPSVDGPPCTCEGFMEDPKDCKKFYRCVSTGAGSYQRFEFECGPDTVWDQNLLTCNHPWAANRKGCTDNANAHPPHGTQAPTEPTVTAGATETAPTRTPPDHGSSAVPPSGESSPVVPPESSGAPPSGASSVAPPSEPSVAGPPCTCEGFMEDPKDCKKFYRCVGTGAGSYQRFEFECGPDTVWDQNVLTCNHPWAANRKGCTDNANTHPPHGTQAPTEPTVTAGATETAPTRTPSDHGSSAAPPSGESSPVVPPESSGAPPSGSSSAPPSSGASSPAPPSSAAPPSDGSSAVPPSGESSTGPQCTCEGFMEDPKDCKKFYRCVDTGTGSYHRYEFECGPDTVWDQSIKTCNHPWAANRPECTGNTGPTHPSSGTPAPTEPTVTAGSSETAPTQVPDDHSSSVVPPSGGSSPAPPPKGSSAAPPSSESSPAPPSGSSVAPPSEGSVTGPQCTCEGFMEDPKDCRKFYRCVDMGTGSYHRYDFICGPDTVWDQSVQTCNHPWAVNRPECGGTAKPHPSNGTPAPSEPTVTAGSSESVPTRAPPTHGSSVAPPSESSTVPSSGESSTAPPPSGTSVAPPSEGSSPAIPSEESSTVPPCDSSTNVPTSGESSGSPPTGDSSTSPPSGSSSATSPPSSSGIPPSDSPSTVPPSASPSTVPPTDSPSTIPPTESPSSVPPSVSASTVPPTDSPSSVPPSGSPPTVPPSSGPTTGAPCSNEVDGDSGMSKEPACGDHPNDNCFGCKEEGFFPNNEDCTKFYRCVSTGHGTYWKYEFSCGPGTAWDQSLLTCNHRNQVASCNSGGSPVESTTGKPEKITTGPETTSESAYPTSSSSESTATESSSEIGTSTEPCDGATDATTDHSVTESKEPVTDTSTNSTPDFGSTISSEVTTAVSEPTSTETSEASTVTEEQSTMTESTSDGTETVPPLTGHPDISVETSTPESSEQHETTTEVEESSTETTVPNTSTESCPGGATPSPTSCNEPPPTGSCPVDNLTPDQILLVCPTGFRRHPTHCNIFYQCTSDSPMDIKIASFACPDNTIFDEKKIQCLPEHKSSKPCNGVKVSARVYRRADESAMSMMYLEQLETLCPDEGYHPYNNEECSSVYYKCKNDANNELRGYMYECPEGFVFSQVSRRCERLSSLPGCTKKYNFVEGNGGSTSKLQLPIESSSVSPTTLAN